jgi:hypothetical protein
MLKGRFIPPWINTRLVLHDGDVTAFASVPGWLRRPLRAALHEAGVDVEERRGWAIWNWGRR